MGVYIFIFFIGLFGSIIGSAGGGSALISMPLLTLLGITPNQAIATAKVGALGTLLSGLYSFARAGKVDKKIGGVCALFGLMGSIVGGYILIHINASLLEGIFGICTLIIILLMAFKKRIYATKIKLPHFLIGHRYTMGYFSFFLVGIWGGLLAGQAIIATFVLVEVFGKSFTEASGTRKLTGLTIALGAIGVYIFGDVIRWDYGFAMLGGTLLGGYLGSEFSLKKGEKFIEIIFYIMAVLLSVKSIWKLL
ncbi:sulfite exporter TauE/SafE family protein [Candidatus Gracilibacteria bacterium]|nr:sulfite exporter TauE/SafE family protein [Candidatus Gracilibacteria bacterium]